MAVLEDRLDTLPEDVRELLARHRFDRARWVAQAAKARGGNAAGNRVRGVVEPPRAGDIGELPAAGSPECLRLEAVGADALRRGECALCVLAGGMATRMGGVVKALVEALPGRTFLDLRLAEQAALGARMGCKPPLWLMTSAATDQAIRETLRDRLAAGDVAVFSQYLSLRLTPDGDLFLDPDGLPSEYAPGHGDLPDALRESGLLDAFVARGGRVVMVANLDNLGATLDPVLLGWHLEHGAPVSCEVADKLAGDRGGIPARVDGRPVVLEEFRLPEGFDAEAVRVFNTNTFFFDARSLSELRAPWSFFRVEKRVDGAPVIQFERLIGEVTTWLDTRFVRVPRAGAASRFLPAKDFEELAARRREIEAVAHARGML
jgi:UTP--glucose-1-phosphate uridylyltransferase